MLHSQQSEEAFSIELEQHCVEAGLSHHKANNSDFEIASSVSEDSIRQSAQDSSAEELSEEVQPWTAEDNKINWEEEYWYRDERSRDFLPPPQPYPFYPHSQLSAHSDTKWILGHL